MLSGSETSGCSYCSRKCLIQSRKWFLFENMGPLAAHHHLLHLDHKAQPSSQMLTISWGSWGLSRGQGEKNKWNYHFEACGSLWKGKRNSKHGGLKLHQVLPRRFIRRHKGMFAKVGVWMGQNASLQMDSPEPRCAYQSIKSSCVLAMHIQIQLSWRGEYFIYMEEVFPKLQPFASFDSKLH